MLKYRNYEDKYLLKLNKGNTHGNNFYNIRDDAKCNHLRTTKFL